MNIIRKPYKPGLGANVHAFKIVVRAGPEEQILIMTGYYRHLIFIEFKNCKISNFPEYAHFKKSGKYFQGYTHGLGSNFRRKYSAQNEQQNQYQDRSCSYHRGKGYVYFFKIEPRPEKNFYKAFGNKVYYPHAGLLEFQFLYRLYA